MPLSPAGEPEEEVERRWDVNLKKFVPRRKRVRARKEWDRSPLAEGSRQLQVKIMEAHGEYKLLYRDLMHLYGLSLPEARHAVSQLERLLWGRSVFEMAERLSTFCRWKVDFSYQLQTINAPGRKTGPWPFRKYDYTTIKATWQRLDQSTRKSLWPRRVLSALNRNPEILPTFIRATFDHSWCPSYFLEDIVYLLYRTIGPSRLGGKDGRQVVELVLFTLEHSPPRVIAFDQSVLYTVISVLSLDKLVDFYEVLKRTEHPVNSNTLQHIASRFAKYSPYKMHAADVICSLTEAPDYNINLPAAASICTSLLTLDPHQPIPEGQAQPDELFRLLLEHGFRPNLLTLTALMRNFCVRKRLDTAWKIFDLLLEHNFEPDPHVFSILLNGSKHSFDVPSIRKIIEIVFSRDAWTGIIVDDFLDTMYRENESQPVQKRRQKKANNAWRPMLQLYAKFFDLRPLQKFFSSPLENVIAGRGVNPRHATTITDLADALSPLPDHLLFKPTGHTLLYLLAAHARSVNNSAEVIAQYRRFTRLLNKGDPIAARLIADKGTMVYDIYLRAMMQFRERVRMPMSIIYNMMLKAERERKRTGGNNVLHPLPSVYTWTVLLNGFKNHKHIGGALAVLDMMLQLGNVQPNIVTWNALINAYALVGHVHGAVRTMRLLEQAGYATDDFTVKAFGPFSRERREHAIRLLEKARGMRDNAFDRSTSTSTSTSGGPRPITPQSVLHLPGRPRDSGRYAPLRFTTSFGRQRFGWHLGSPRGGGRGAAPPPPRPPQRPPNLAENLARAQEEWDKIAAELVQRRANVGAPSRSW